MFDYQRLFHTGVRVANLDKAMHELGTAACLSWAQPVEREQPVWTPAGGEQSVRLRFTYSTEGPQHLELLEGEPGSVWDGRHAPGVHHIGVWVEDVAAEARRLVDEGWEVVAAALRPDKGFGGFAYVSPPSGMIVELVSAAVEPMFVQWWAGGPFGGSHARP